MPTTMLLANAGTPLMWAQVLYLLPVNLLIALAEGAFIAWRLKRPFWPTVGLMLVANYASAAAGMAVLDGMVLGPLATLEQRMDWLQRLPAALLGVYTLLFTVTLAVEALVFLRTARRHAPPGAAWRAFLVAQLATNLFLLAWFLLPSQFGLYRSTKLVDSADFLTPLPADVYTISVDGRRVERRRLEVSSTPELVLELPSKARYARLDVVEAEGVWRLVVLQDHDAEVAEVMVLPKEGPRVVVPPGRAIGFSNRRPARLHGWRRTPVDWRTAGEGNVYTGDWALEGLVVAPENGRRYNVALEAIGAKPSAWWATTLPSEQVIFQFGDGHVMVHDLATRRLATWAIGRSPVVVWDVALAAENNPLE